MWERGASSCRGWGTQGDGLTSFQRAQNSNKTGNVNAGLKKREGFLDLHASFKPERGSSIVDDKIGCTKGKNPNCWISRKRESSKREMAKRCVHQPLRCCRALMWEC